MEPLKLPPDPTDILAPLRTAPRSPWLGTMARSQAFGFMTAAAGRRWQLTLEGRNRFPIWTADGQRVAFQSDREGDLGIFWQRADGSDAAQRLTKPDRALRHVPESWSPKGERFLFGVTKGSSVSLWTFSLRDKKATPFADVQSPNPVNATFSPDGRWVAYARRSSGRNAGVRAAVPRHRSQVPGL